eukprot:GHRR01036257.1.p1 GENE.GHRR01036257.1~~GHRR01036257.1.p1  ORF type:complete len:135 (-),score=33.63 GHRR01036257.1:121-525(-)
MPVCVLFTAGLNRDNIMQPANIPVAVAETSTCVPVLVLFIVPDILLAVRTRIDDILDQVGLNDRANNLVGVAGASGLPSKARRRLTIAVELIANPPVMCLDEPTSGTNIRVSFITPVYQADVRRADGLPVGSAR